MRINSQATPPVAATTASATGEQKVYKDESICRVYANVSLKTKKEYMKLYMVDEKGERITFACFKPAPSADKDAPDYELLDQRTKKPVIKINKMVKGEKESLKIDFLDGNTGSFVKSFIAVKMLNKKTDKSPDYVAFSSTLRTAK